MGGSQLAPLLLYKTVLKMKRRISGKPPSAGARMAPVDLFHPRVFPFTERDMIA
jgi:hypothetical protein